MTPQDARPSRQRHADKADLRRPLRTWIAAMNPDRPDATSWLRHDLKPDNDNNDPDEPYVPQPLDTAYEIRPSISEMRTQWSGDPKKQEKPSVEYRRVPEARLDGEKPHGSNLYPIAGLVEHGMQRNVPDYAASKTGGGKAPRRDRRIVTRIGGRIEIDEDGKEKHVGGLEFSNGEQVEKCLVLKEDRVAYGDVRIPAGGLVRFNGRKPWEKWRRPKGRVVPQNEPTVAHSQTAREGATAFADPVVDSEWSQTLRWMVGTENAMVLDLAVNAANFREIGEHFGRHGKHAERLGIKKLKAACARVEAVVAANDNIQMKKSGAA